MYLIMKFTVIFLPIVFYLSKVSSDGNEDLYKLLGVPRDANVKDIRRAFKNLAVKMHPDKNQVRLFFVLVDYMFLK